MQLPKTKLRARFAFIRFGQLNESCTPV